MKKYWSHLIIYIIASGLIPVVYNGCGKLNGFNLIDSGTDIGSTGARTPPENGNLGEDVLVADQLALGQALYEKNCTICHGTLALSTKLGKTSADITTAFKTVPSMASLASLTTEQVAQIALALNKNSLSLKNETSVHYRTLISNRYLLSSQLHELFVASTNLDSNDTTIQNTINSLVMKHPEGFGGNCSRNDPGCLPNPCANNGACRGQLSTSQNAEVNPSSSPVRKGYLIQACEKILSVDKAVNNLAQKAAIDVTQAPTLATLKTLALFAHRERPQDSAALDQLMSLANSAKTANMNVLDQWRFVMLALCEASTSDLL